MVICWPYSMMKGIIRKTNKFEYSINMGKDPGAKMQRMMRTLSQRKSGISVTTESTSIWNRDTSVALRPKEVFHSHAETLA
jgi:hypothetical protein